MSVDADDEPEALSYIITGDPSGGTLARDGVALLIGEVFTQADVNAGLITFTAGDEPGAYGFDFELVDDSDSGAEASGFFNVGIGAVTELADDNGATDEDTPLGILNVLENDIGTNLQVVKHDPQSTLGASVSVDAAGNVTYDPTGSPDLQALDDNETAQDSFTVQINDFANVNTNSTVTITVSGINDAPVVAGENVSGSEEGQVSLNLLANDSDIDANDVLSVASFNANDPGTFVSDKGATVSVGADGSFSYDASTSTALSGLADGESASDTFTYQVSDGDESVQGSITVTVFGTPGASYDVASVDGNTSVVIGALDNDTNYSGELGTATAGAALDLNADTLGNTNEAWQNAAAG